MTNNCPECGGPTTRKGITVRNGPWKDKGETWRACLNCSWNSRKARREDGHDDEEEHDDEDPGECQAEPRWFK